MLYYYTIAMELKIKNIQLEYHINSKKFVFNLYNNLGVYFWRLLKRKTLQNPDPVPLFIVKTIIFQAQCHTWFLKAMS